MTYEGIDWNSQWVRSLTLEQFINRGIAEGKYAEFKPQDQLILLKEAYRLATSGNG